VTRHRVFPRPRPHGLPRALVLTIVVLALLVCVRYGYVSWLERINPHQPFPYPGNHLGDYKDAVWLPGRDLLDGRDPYDPVAFARAHPATQGYSPYTPSHLVVAALFAPLSWPVGTAVWTALSTVAISIMGLVTGRRLIEVAGWDKIARARVAGAGLGVIGAWAWRPDAMAIGLGQPTAIYGPIAALVGLAVLGPLAKDTSRRDSADGGGAGRIGRTGWLSGQITVGLWAALSLSKPQIGLQALLAMVSVQMVSVQTVSDRRWRALGVAVGTTAVASLAVATTLAGGPGHLGAWLAALPGHLRSAPSRFAAPGDDPWVDVSATAYRAGLRHGAGTVIGPLLALALVSCALVAAARLRRTGTPWLGALALTLGGLAAIPHGIYDALLLYPVAVLAAGEWWRPTGGARRSRWGLATVVLALLVGAVPNSVPLFEVQPGAVVGVVLLVASAGAVGAAAVARIPSAADRALSAGSTGGF
jgi:Glycosyltransferase family 87